jgi:hypothetical protein
MDRLGYPAIGRDSVRLCSGRPAGEYGSVITGVPLAAAEISDSNDVMLKPAVAVLDSARYIPTVTPSIVKVPSAFVSVANDSPPTAVVSKPGDKSLTSRPAISEGGPITLPDTAKASVGVSLMSTPIWVCPYATAVTAAFVMESVPGANVLGYFHTASDAGGGIGK